MREEAGGTVEVVMRAAARAVCGAALDRGSTDNVSAVCIDLR